MRFHERHPISTGSPSREQTVFVPVEEVRSPQKKEKKRKEREREREGKGKGKGKRKKKKKEKWDTCARGVPYLGIAAIDDNQP